MKNVEIQLKSTPIFKITVTDSGIARDISGFTTLQFRFKKSNKTVLETVAVFETDGTNGIVIYKAQIDEIDVSGTWSLQFHGINLTDEIYTETNDFEVKKNI